MINIEADVQDIKENMLQISRKLDELLTERDVIAGMKLSEPALARFLNEEPDLYTIKDARVVYRSKGKSLSCRFPLRTWIRGGS